MPQGYRAKQSFETFAVDITQAIRSNLLSFSETDELRSGLAVIQTRLNIHRNSFVPINKLPAEILARIFEFVIAPELLHNLSEWPASTPARQATWNRSLVFVCTRWCEIVTRCQRMWYYIVDDDADAPKKHSPRAVLRLSGSAVPLHLYMVSTPEPPTESVCRWVIKNQPLRVEALYIRLPDRTSTEAMLKSLATPLPSLCLLSVDGTWEYRRGLGSNMPEILGGGPLNLKALAWSLSIPFIPGNAFPNLTDLNLNNLGVHVLTFDRLLRLLSNCPRLETLIISQSSLDSKNGAARERGVVKLEHLRALWVQSMRINTALTVLMSLQLPSNATVRLSDLTQYEYHTGPAQPPATSVPFLQQMHDLISLDIISHGGGRKRRDFHFVAVGTSSRFWIQFDAGGVDLRSYVRYLYGMLPKTHLRTLRFSMQQTSDLVFVRDTMRHPLPSLHTLFIRRKKVTCLSAIAAVSWSLCPGGAPELYIYESDTDSDSEPSDDDHSEGHSDNHSSYDSENDDDGDDNSDHSFDTTSTEKRDVPAHFPIDCSRELFAPELKVIGLEVKHASTASLRPFVRMVEARKKCGHPLDTVLCSLKGTDPKDVDALREHVVDAVREVRRDDKLWVPTIDEGWLVKNDYWRLYPDPRDDSDDSYDDWGLNMRDW